MLMKNNFDIIALKYSPDEIKSLKREFARLLVKFLNKPDVMFGSLDYDVLFKGDVSCALFAINHWVTDPEVNEYKKDYVNGNKANETLYTKTDLARKYQEVIDNSRDEKVVLVAMREFSNLMGYVPKESKLEQTGQTTVMLISDNGSVSNWEQSLLANQQKLQDVEDVTIN